MSLPFDQTFFNSHFKKKMSIVEKTFKEINTYSYTYVYSFSYDNKQKRSTEGCSKFKSPETRQVQERLVSTLEHMQVPKWDRTRCPEE